MALSSWYRHRPRWVQVGIAVTLIGLLLLAFVDVGLGRQTLRRRLKPLVPIEIRHQIVALTTSVFPTPLETDDLAPVAHVGRSPYAINTFLEQEVEEEKIRRTLAMIRDGGFTMIRQQLVWGEIEVPGKGQFVDRATGGSSWAKYDRIVRLAREYDLDVMLRIETSPVWARPGNPKLETPPDDIFDYGDFVERVVERYHGQVRYYQMWNEPNLGFEWGGAGPAPAPDYVALLKVGYERAKAVDPSVVVVSAALAPTIEMSTRGWNDLIFLQQMYDAGAADYFDVLGMNSYGLWSGPDDRRLDRERDVNFSRPLLIREIMVKNGDSATPIWPCEVGWNALPEDFPVAPEKILFGRVTREVQARYTARAYRRAQEEWPWVGVMALWHFRMPNPEAPRLLQQYYFNAVEEDFSPQPVYWAMQELASAPTPVERGYRQEDDWRLAWTGDWRSGEDARAVLGGFRRSRQVGDSVAFRFRGTRLELVTTRGPGAGAIAVTVDGAAALANRVRPDATGRAVVDLRAPAEAWGERITVAAGLHDAIHTVEIRTLALDGRAGDVVIDGLVVDREAGVTWLDLLLILTGAGVLGMFALGGGRR